MHTIIDAKITEMVPADRLPRIVRGLVAEIDMTPIADCVVNEFEDYDLGASAIQLLAESHISIHYMWDRKEVWIDVFSCKPFNQYVVLQYLTKHLGLLDILRFDTLTRGS